MASKHEQYSEQSETYSKLYEAHKLNEKYPPDDMFVRIFCDTRESFEWQIMYYCSQNPYSIILITPWHTEPAYRTRSIRNKKFGIYNRHPAVGYKPKLICPHPIPKNLMCFEHGSTMIFAPDFIEIEFETIHNKHHD